MCKGAHPAPCTFWFKKKKKAQRTDIYFVIASIYPILRERWDICSVIALFHREKGALMPG